MRRLWKSLALSLTVMAASARAQDARPSPEPAVSIGRPVAQIGRPVVLPQQAIGAPVYNSGLQPVSFDNSGTGSVIRGAAPDTPVRPMNAVDPAMFNWRTPGDETAPAPQSLGQSNGPVSSSPMPVGPVLADPHIVYQGPGYQGPGSPDCGSCCDTSGGWSLFNRGCGCQGGCDGGMGCDCCYPGDRLYVNASALLWWTKGSPTPPLVSASTSQGDFLTQGAIGKSTVLFGGNDISADMRVGGQLTAGYWFTDDHLIGVEGSFFFLGQLNNSFNASSDGSTVLARPITLVAQPATLPSPPFPNLVGAGRELVAGVQLSPFGGTFTNAGTITVGTSSSFWGGEANLRTNLCCGPNYFLDLVGGFRLLSLDETLAINENITVVSTNGNVGGLPVGTNFLVNDSFSTKNRFYGGQLGAAGEWRFGRWSVGADAKLGMGATEQSVDINGVTVTSPPGAATTSSLGGLLSRAGTAGNIGHFSRDQFSLVPEVGMTVGYQLTPHLRAFAGYNFLYWTNVARPGSQIDTGVDPNQVLGAPGPGVNRPTFAFHNSDFWAQGVSVGLEFRW